MQISDLIGILTFTLTILGLAFALGQQAFRLKTLEKDLDALAKIQREQYTEADKRLDKLSNSMSRTDQRLAQLEGRAFGEDTAGRRRD